MDPPSSPPLSASLAGEPYATPPLWREAALCAALGVLAAGLVAQACCGRLGVTARIWLHGLALPAGGTGVAVLVLGRGRWRALARTLELPPSPDGATRAALAGLGAGLGAFAFAIPLVLGSQWVLRQCGVAPPPDHFAVLLGNHPEWGLWISVSVLVLLVAPVAEEVLFRVVVVEAFRMAGIPAAGVFSAVVFAAAHGRPDQFLALCLLALWLYRLRARYGSLRPAILAHAVFNVLALAGSFLRLYSTP